MSKIGMFELNKVHCGDALEMLRQLPDESVQCCVSSPPYWNLRNYSVAGQIGLEKTIEEYVAKVVVVFEEVRRILRKNATCWINLGDSYAVGTNSQKSFRRDKVAVNAIRGTVATGYKPKDLCGIPWRVAFALQAAGWYLRMDVIWSKKNCMPESVTDRPTKSHEYLFLLAKSPKYYYDAEAIRDPVSGGTHARISQNLAAQVGSFRANGGNKTNGPMKAVLKGSTRKLSEAGSGIKSNRSFEAALSLPVESRNKRSVWEIATEPFPGSHFAVFPKALVEPCILAGSKPGDVVLDPFAGSGTTGVVALQHGRMFIGFDLNPEYCQKLAAPRLAAAERGQTLEQYQNGQRTIFDLMEARECG